MNIFLLEDDIALQNAIKMFLESKDFQVDPYHDGEEALQALDRHSYDLYYSISMSPASTVCNYLS